MTDHHARTGAGATTVCDEQLTRYQLDILLYLGVEERTEDIGSWLARYGHGHEGDERRRDRALETLADRGLLEVAPGRVPPYRPSSRGTSLLRRRAQQYELTFDAGGEQTAESLPDPPRRS